MTDGRWSGEPPSIYVNPQYVVAFTQQCTDVVRVTVRGFRCGDLYMPGEAKDLAGRWLKGTR